MLFLENDDLSDSFALIVDNKTCDKLKFPIYPFVVKDVGMKKDKFIQDIIDAFENVLQTKIDSVLIEIYSQMDDIFNILKLYFQTFLKRGDFKSLDFTHSKLIARSLNKSKYVFTRTKERLNRTFSMRRAPSQLLSVSMENLTSAIPISSPSSRLSKVFNNLNFFAQKENDIYSNTQINSFNHISVICLNFCFAIEF